MASARTLSFLHLAFQSFGSLFSLWCCAMISTRFCPGVLPSPAPLHFVQFAQPLEICCFFCGVSKLQLPCDMAQPGVMGTCTRVLLVLLTVFHGSACSLCLGNVQQEEGLQPCRDAAEGLIWDRLLPDLLQGTLRTRRTG